ncbi:hypothetical protein B1114_001963 [Salmonella enterica subsp. enterica serovar Florida]|nr:hypothetical protein [Salmonella enterica subsp. enterica serovar Midway]EDS7168486.1 hypothetical protein [Salmonella enterica subsp. enterica serovar Florida]EDS7250671.1 hypothetical protein [Salmonella enterica subsp. enterica]EDT4764386.1 hypothetical protein [Salmonella enterica subsp. enterica serovar Florida]
MTRVMLHACTYPPPLSESIRQTARTGTVDACVSSGGKEPILCTPNPLSRSTVMVV